MGWYLRKSVKVGPVRFNLSKSGIGTSVGVTGFRVGVRPNGSSYVHAGRHGIYYREELGSKKLNNEEEINQNLLNEVNSSNTFKFYTASSKELKPTSRKELLSKLNKSYNSIRLDYICAFLFIIASSYLYFQNRILGVVFLVIGIIVSVLVAKWETKRRTVTINYDFEDKNAKKHKKLLSAFNNLVSNKKVWSMIDTRNVYGSHESKLNGGAGDLVSKSSIQVGEGKPPWVSTNIDVPVIKTKNQTLYMMPDGILVYDANDVGFVEYDDITIKHNTTNFIEENPPRDAEIIYHTWKYANRDGGPDRRFNNNHEIPVCLYGELKIKSSSGMYVYLMTSKSKSVSDFAKEFMQR